MARNKIQTTTPAQPTYHLAERLRGLAIDSLYRFTEGLRTLTPLEDLTVTALITAHPWGYSSQVHAHDAAGQLHAAAEATAAHPLPNAINSRVRSFRAGPLTWHHCAGRITDADAPAFHSVPTRYVAAGRHHYEIRQDLDFGPPATGGMIRETWHLSIDGRHRQPAFAGVVGATEFVLHEYEPTL